MKFLLLIGLGVLISGPAFSASEIVNLSVIDGKLQEYLKFAAMTVDPKDDSIIALGIATRNVNYQGVPIYKNGSRENGAFLIKTSNTGKLIFSAVIERQVGSWAYESTGAIALDSNGDIYTALTSLPGGTQQWRDSYVGGISISRYSGLSGEKLWTTTTSIVRNVEYTRAFGRTLKVVGSELILGGWVEGTLTFGSTTVASGTYPRDNGSIRIMTDTSAFLSKLDTSSGVFLQTKLLGSGTSLSGLATDGSQTFAVIKVIPTENIYNKGVFVRTRRPTGSFEAAGQVFSEATHIAEVDVTDLRLTRAAPAVGHWDANLALTPDGIVVASDKLISKFNSNLNPEWNKSYTISNTGVTPQVAVTSQGKIKFLTGGYQFGEQHLRTFSLSGDLLATQSMICDGTPGIQFGKLALTSQDEALVGATYGCTNLRVEGESFTNYNNQVNAKDNAIIFNMGL